MIQVEPPPDLQVSPCQRFRWPPPDTFGLTEQAKIENFNVKAYYNGIGCAFPGFAGKFGSAEENVLGFGGISNNEKTRAFYNCTKK